MTTPIPLDHPSLTQVEESGQTLYLLGEDLLAQLRAMETPTVADRALGVGRLVEQYAAIAEQTPGMEVAFGAPREGHQPWILYHVVRGDEGSVRRVLAEGQTCFACGWTGMTGNARDLAIYEGTDEPMVHLEAALELPALPCPGCGERLTRPAIWIHTVRDAAR